MLYVSENLGLKGKDELRANCSFGTIMPFKSTKCEPLSVKKKFLNGQDHYVTKYRQQCSEMDQA